jgi:putative oxidoreductase
MPAFITFGRILFAVLFIVSGALQLYDLTAAAKAVAEKLVIPAALTDYKSQIEALAGMPMPRLLAITAGSVELICGTMIALNFGVRFFAILLIFFVIAATLYSHDFWNQPDPEVRIDNMVHALKNLSIIGALFMIAGYGRTPRTAEPVYGDV